MKLNTGQTKNKHYSDVLQFFWRDLYGEGGRTVYSLERFGDVKPEWTNAEHIFPMSWVVKSLSCSDRRNCRRHSLRFRYIEGDLHNIYPARQDLNLARGDYGFGEVDVKAGQSKVDQEEERIWIEYDFSIDYERRLVEPPHASKGEVARAMFYIVDAYDLKLFKKQAKLLLSWHKMDQPSKEEARRNDVIEGVQGTRNYFIDKPESLTKVLNRVQFDR